MAQHQGRQGPWPRVREEQQTKDARFLHPNGFQKYDRSLVGPLRFGTEPGVGPRGPAVALGRAEERSDMGMDRVTPREFDSMGTSMSRYRPQNESDLISRQKRGES
jgi:hypothetical protein